MYAFGRAAVRELDKLCVEEFGIPSIVLMENAAIGVAAVALRTLEVPAADDTIDPEPGPGSPLALAFCGAGNNGGDGLAVMRHLHNHGVRVLGILGGPAAAYRGDAAINLAICRRMGLSLATVEGTGEHIGRLVRTLIADHGTPDLILDAVLGTGVDRPAAGAPLELIRAINGRKGHGAPILAVDLPSGLDADSGLPLPGGEAVRADITVSLAGVKKGMLLPESRVWTGMVHVAGIGAPIELLRRLGREVPPE